MVGIPPTVGFFSKWYLVWAGLDAGRWVFVAVILGSSLLTAVYLFRVLETFYLQSDVGARSPRPDTATVSGRRDPAPTKDVINDLPWAMRLPLVLTAVAIVVVGIGSSWLVTEILIKVVGHV
jgi:multicomponent Na+:H+ antiporter subunit D